METKNLRAFSSTTLHSQGPVNYGSFDLSLHPELGNRSGLPQVVVYAVTVRAKGIHGVYLGAMDHLRADTGVVLDTEDEVLLSRGLNIRAVHTKKLGVFRDGTHAYEAYRIDADAIGVTPKPAYSE